MARRLFLIDAHSCLYQAFYAIRQLTAPDGAPVNAVYGFTNLLMKLFTEIKPDYVAVAMDTPGKTFRHERYEQYKATRKEMPSELQAQVPLIRDVIGAFGVPVFAVEGFEADDIIAVIAKYAEKRGVETSIITRDKDAKQLLSPLVKMFNTRDDSAYSPEDLERDWGVKPGQVVDVLALMGDASDNIPGVPGVGEKTALKLVHEYGDLENVLANADKVKGKKLSQNLREYADQARMSREMVILREDVPLDMDLEQWRPGRNIDTEKLTLLFEKFGFKRLLKALARLEAAGQAPEQKQIAKAISRVEGELDRIDPSRYRLIDSEAAFEHLLAGLRGQDSFAVDTETTSRMPTFAKLVGISFSWRQGEAHYLPLMAPDAKWLPDTKAALDALRPALEDDRIAKVGQNLKYDMVVLRRHGVNLRGVGFDTMVAAWLLDSSRTNYNIDVLARDYLGYRKVPTSDIIGRGKNQVTMDQVPVRQVSEYACEDADIARRLWLVLEPDLRKEKLDALFRGVEMPLVTVLAEMEYNGVALDCDFLAEMSEETGREIDALAAKIHGEAGEEFNIASTQQLSEILFTRRKLRPVRKTKTGYSTDADVLETLARQTDDPLPAMVLEYRRLTKLKSTYIDALPAMVNPDTGRVHTSFNQTGTATGRLSSSDPNLQNIPIRTEMGRKIRRAFVAGGEDRMLLTADYSQIELRMLAHLSGDETLTRAFMEGQDIHRHVASQVYGVEAGDVTSEMRRQAKAVNFGIIYGQSAFGLSREVGISVPEARQFIDAYFARYSSVRGFLDGVIREAESDGFVRTILNRKRPIPEITSQSPVRRNAAHRMAMNTVLQGSAADLIKVAMNNIYERIAGREDIKMVLQIHDELLFEVKAGAADKYRELVEEEMTGAMKLRVPLKVDIGVGRNWLETN